MSRRARRTPVAGQIDMLAELELADAHAEATARVSAAGHETLDAATLTRLCRETSETCAARDRDEAARFGRTLGGVFQQQSERLLRLAAWLEAGDGRVPSDPAGWPCPLCDVEPGHVCGFGSTGRVLTHSGRGWTIGLTQPGAGWGSEEILGAHGCPAERCTPTVEDGPARARRGRCLGCGWRGPVRRDEHTAVEDAHDHAFPEWRALPVVEPAPAAENPATDKSVKRWEERVGRAVAAAMGEHWLAQGGPIRTRRTPPGTRDVPGRAPGGGYDLAALDSSDRTVMTGRDSIGQLRPGRK